MFHVGALGTDFRSASLKMRDALYLERERVVQFIDAIPDDAPLSEVVALSTCNRIEIFYVCQNHDDASLWLKNYLTTFHHIPVGMIDSVMKSYHCGDAVRHLFQVVSGVESMVFGEHEILGQVRDAYFHCFKNNSTNSYLNRLFQQAIATGKKVRSSTAAGRGVLSIASIAVERMIELSGPVAEKRILIVGCGTMGVRAIKRLKKETVNKLTLCNRNGERAEKFAEKFGIAWCGLHDLASAIAQHDIVFLATSSSNYLITAEMLNNVGERRATPPLLIIDIGAPRNADPQCANVSGVQLVTIDDLKETAGRRLVERQRAMGAVNEIIEEQVQEFKRWYCYKRDAL